MNIFSLFNKNKLRPNQCIKCKKIIEEKYNLLRKSDYTLCMRCGSEIKSFRILSDMTYLGGSAASEASESLELYVFEKNYFLYYKSYAFGGEYIDFIEIPFGFFATSSYEVIANKLNSVSYNGNGFGLRRPSRINGADIAKSQVINNIIEFDKAKGR